MKQAYPSNKKALHLQTNILAAIPCRLKISNENHSFSTRKVAISECECIQKRPNQFCWEKSLAVWRYFRGEVWK